MVSHFMTAKDGAHLVEFVCVYFLAFHHRFSFEVIGWVTIIEARP